jgi:phosphatidylglycerophosphatase A
MKLRFAKVIATFFGMGYAPFAPGTFGSLLAFIISLLIYQYFVNAYMVIHVCMIMASYILGVWSTEQVAVKWGSDPSKVVIDEAHGFWVGIFLFKPSLIILGVGLILFRIFDIWKPLGIRKLDEISHSGHAVMLDDTAAGILTALVIMLLLTLKIVA